MQIIQRQTKELIPAEYNPRQIDKDAFEQLKTSLESFKCVEPAVININPDRLNIIVGGHQRIKAAKALKWKEFPCIEVDLELEREKELNIRLNKNTGDFDFDMLANHFEVEDLVDWGFDESEFGMDVEEIGEVEGEDDVPEAPVDPITVKGDVWTLGEHRLVCGDSTSIDDVDKLMDGNKADMVFTDPPYGVDYEGITNDDEKGLPALLDAVFTNYTIASHKGAAVYIFHADRTAHIFREAYNKYFHFSSMIVWVKNSLTLSQTDYQSQHEPCMYGWINNGTHQWFSDRKQTSVWEYERKHFEGHTTPKPVDLVCNAVTNSSKKGGNIIDLFGGSGSTLIACEKTKRKCFMMELDEKYCDVIIKRWQDFTGKEAINDNGQTYNELSQMRITSNGDSN